MKAFADNKFNVDKMMFSFFASVENIVGNRAFSPFLKLFSKALKFSGYKEAGCYTQLRMGGKL